jgi:hypothetical protein
VQRRREADERIVQANGVDHCGETFGDPPVISTRTCARRQRAGGVLDLYPIREVRNRLRDDEPALELRHQEGRPSLGHAAISIGEQEADGRHRLSVSRSRSSPSPAGVVVADVHMHLKSNFRSARRAQRRRSFAAARSVSPRAVGGLSTCGSMARIDDYSFGRVTVDREEHTLDVIVLPRRVVRDWVAPGWSQPRARGLA